MLTAPAANRAATPGRPRGAAIGRGCTRDVEPPAPFEPGRVQLVRVQVRGDPWSVSMVRRPSGVATEATVPVRPSAPAPDGPVGEGGLNRVTPRRRRSSPTSRLRPVPPAPQRHGRRPSRPACCNALTRPRAAWVSGRYREAALRLQGARHSAAVLQDSHVPARPVGGRDGEVGLTVAAPVRCRREVVGERAGVVTPARVGGAVDQLQVGGVGSHGLQGRSAPGAWSRA